MSSQEPAPKTRCCHGNQVVTGGRQEAALPKPCRMASFAERPQGLLHIEGV